MLQRSEAVPKHRLVNNVRLISGQGLFDKLAPCLPANLLQLRLQCFQFLQAGRFADPAGQGVYRFVVRINAILATLQIPTPYPDQNTPQQQNNRDNKTHGSRRR